MTLVATSQDGRIWVDESGHENRFEFEKVLDNGMKLEATGSDGRLFLTGEEVLVGFDETTELRSMQTEATVISNRMKRM